MYSSLHNPFEYLRNMMTAGTYPKRSQNGSQGLLNWLNLAKFGPHHSNPVEFPYSLKVNRSEAVGNHLYLFPQSVSLNMRYRTVITDDGKGLILSNEESKELLSMADAFTFGLEWFEYNPGFDHLLKFGAMIPSHCGRFVSPKVDFVLALQGSRNDIEHYKCKFVLTH